MAIAYMTIVPNISQYDSTVNDNKAYEFDETLTSASNGNTVIIPRQIKNISTILAITTGSGKVQFTTNKLEDVLSDTNVVWFDWAAGLVTENTQDSATPVTAIRQVNVSGTTRLMIRAQ